MCDMAEAFNDMKEASKKKRAANRQYAPKFLERADISFTVKNRDAHLIVEGGDCFIDFWPGTGRWITRANRTIGFGVKSLINFIERTRKKE